MKICVIDICYLFMVYDFYFPILGSIFVFFSMLSYWSSFYFEQSKKVLKNILPFFLLGGNLCFAITLLFRWVSEKYFPLSNLYESLIFLCWIISTIQLILEKKTKSKVIGSLITPILFFLASFSSLSLPIEMQKASLLVPSLQSNWLMMHVSMMMLSYGTLLVGSLLCILYLILSLFNKDFSFGKKITFFELLDNWSYRTIGLGFPFLTLGIISGAVWANEAWGSYWSWDPKETWALITWLVFASYLHARIVKGWQGKNAAIIGAFGFFIIWVCYLGVNFFSKGLHSYGWISTSIIF
jgi:cytochrome c-type biogenesis protein CcsB